MNRASQKSNAKLKNNFLDVMNTMRRWCVPVLVICLIAGIVQASGILNADRSIGSTGGSNITGFPDSDSHASKILQLPIGGFTSAYAYASPNATIETEYVFYSRDWGPGEVQINVTGSDYAGEISSDTASVMIEPAEFLAEPHHNYTVKVKMATGAKFGNPSLVPNDTIHTSTSNGILFKTTAKLKDAEKNLCEDTFIIYPEFPKLSGLPSLASDRISLENETVISLAPGESKQIDFDFYRGQSGISEVTWQVSESPLDVTIQPDSFIAKKNSHYPTELRIHAGKYSVPGEYPIVLSFEGGHTYTTPARYFILVHVADPDKTPLPATQTQKSPLTVFAIIISICFIGAWVKFRK